MDLNNIVTVNMQRPAPAYTEARGYALAGGSNQAGRVEVRMVGGGGGGAYDGVRTTDQLIMPQETQVNNWTTYQEVINTNINREWTQQFYDYVINTGFTPNTVYLHPTAWDHMASIWGAAVYIPGYIKIEDGSWELPVEDQQQINYKI